MIAWIAAVLTAALFAFPAPAAAEDTIAPSEAQLDQLLAPVALYPDGLLANVLVASTYPLEVVELERWLERNPDLSPAEIEQAVESQSWDASVKALAPFRSVVAMMNGELGWMQRVGNAFLASESDVMDAVQRLRRKARDAGSLGDNQRERVIVESDYIGIEPLQPEVVYVPVYDPRVVYGGWWWPDYPPYVWSSFYFGPWDYIVGGIAFGGGVSVWHDWHARYPHPDWRRHNLITRRPGAPVVWRHDPRHRIGVPYADNRTNQIYRPADRDRVRDRRDFRGFDVRPGVVQPQPVPAQRAMPPSIARPMPAPPAIARQMPAPTIQSPHAVAPQPHALQPMPNAVARQQSARGHESLAGRPSNPIARASPKGDKR